MQQFRLCRIVDAREVHLIVNRMEKCQMFAQFLEDGGAIDCKVSRINDLRPDWVVHFVLLHAEH